MIIPEPTESCAEEAHTSAEPSGANELAYWFEVVRDWSGSAFLAGEKVEDEAALKSALYGDLCRLGNHLMAWRDDAAWEARCGHVEAALSRLSRAALRVVNAREAFLSPDRGSHPNLVLEEAEAWTELRAVLNQ